MEQWKQDLADAIEAEYARYAELLATVKKADEAETKSDGSRKPNRLETFVGDETSFVANELVSTMFDLAKNDPDSFAVALSNLREVMKNEVKTMADVVLPEVLANVEVSAEEELDEEVEAMRTEAYEIRQSLMGDGKKDGKLAAAVALELELNIPKKTREVRTATKGVTQTVEVWDLPFVPGTRKSSDESSVGRPSQDSHRQYFLNNEALPAGTSRDKMLFLASDPTNIYSRTELELELRKQDKTIQDEFTVTMPNGNVIESKNLSK